MRPSICIVTAELIGLFKNGGIGTAMTGLAQHLADAGFPVTILYTGAGPTQSRSDLKQWQERYREIGISLEVPDADLTGSAGGPVAVLGFTAPFLVYQHLRDRHFDVISFNDCMGEGAYCLAMKRLGTAFRETALLVGLHSPSQWIFEVNRTPPSLPLFSAFNHAERLSVGLADLLWSPSHYLLDWTLKRGFRHPSRTIVQRYAIPTLPLFQSRPEASRIGADRPSQPNELRIPREIVFFGRLEERKGLRMFCDAISRIEPQLHERGIEVTFLGKHGAVGNLPAGEFIEQAGSAWRFEWRQINDLGREEALAWLLSRPAVAVVTSPADNSPCTVYEALEHGIPLLAARTGGIPELVAEADQSTVLFDYAPEALAAKLLVAITDGVRSVLPAESPRETIDRWVGGLEAWRKYVTVPDRPEPERRICVIMDGADEMDFAESLGSLDARHISRAVLITRTSGQTKVEAPFPLTFVQPDDPQKLLEAIGEDAGEAILMMRNGTLLAPGAEQALIQGLRAPGVDGIVPAGTIGSGAKLKIVLPLGGSPSFCLYQGATPAGLMAVRAERLASAVNARALPSETEFFGLGDYAVAAGLDIWPYPEPLVRHPDHFVQERPGLSARERLAAYSDADATERLYMTAIGYEEFAARLGLVGALKAVRQQLFALGFRRATEAVIARIPAGLAARLRRWSRT